MAFETPLIVAAIFIYLPRVISPAAPFESRILNTIQHPQKKNLNSITGNKFAPPQDIIEWHAGTVQGTPINGLVRLTQACSS